MKSIPLTQLLLAAALACGSTATFAQDAMKPAPMGKKSVTMQDCKDRMATAKGEKRNDASADADTDKACAEMMKHGHGKMMKKDHAPKTDSGATPAEPAK